MIANVLPVVALAGAAMAASCPIAVEIADTTNHVAHVALTNTGSEAITVFKGNTVLDAHATKDLLVSDAAGNPLPFKGMYVNYKKAGLTADLFQTLQPGETVTASVNAAKTYDLEGVDSAQVTAIQGFRYVVGTEAPTKVSDLTSCDDVMSKEATIVPDQSTAASDAIVKREDQFNSRIKKRAITYSGCTTSEESTLKTSFSDAVSMSTKAKTAAASSADYYTTWFKSTSVASTVEKIYGDVAGVQTTAPTVSCTDTSNDCSSDVIAYTLPSANRIVPCDAFWDLDIQLATQCSGDDYDWAGSMLHESTHLFGTDDYAYGPTAAQALSAAKASENADTYEMYAESVRLGGCTTG
ncbi:Uu.00g075060.m01.CDS01 [Anthostomella pinea]|uniref:deuterolysin n=1 Tax=Anthostomella pinea TaxID=933095 RepID=A0AAI8VVL4_9PEZI|nr:Uu.00g075060.m01.CDS01 [Anthostomella pinea]